MINFFKRRRLRKDLIDLESQLLEKVGNEFPDLVEQHEHWDLGFFNIHENPKQIELIHRTDDLQYTRKTKRKHNKCFQIDGLRIKNKATKDFEPITLQVYYNMIHFIRLNFKNSIAKEYDVGSIEIGEIKTTKLDIQNPDLEVVKKALKNETEEVLEKFEIEDTFEIELDGKLYYTVLAMEDGDYLAIDKKGRVFRLIHDHEQPVKKIADGLSELGFSGRKDELANFFEQ